MFEVVSNEEIAPKLHRMDILAPRVARARKPGQFVIVRVGKGAERIPLTIADDDPAAGTITLIIQAVGPSTRAIVAVPAGGGLSDVAGPLGQPTEIERLGRVACVGGGVGTAVLFPLAKGLAEAGNALTCIIGGRSEKYVILKDELGAISERRIALLLDGRLNGGLPAFLSAGSGLESGMMLLQYTAAALASEDKVLSHPASSDSIPTSANQEDHVSMGSISARHTMAVVANVQRILALELMCAAQALDFRLAQSAEAGLSVAPGAGVVEAHRRIRAVIPHLDRDRLQTADIEAATALVRDGALADLALS